ncbi:hypothetical protein ACFVYA_38160 [Amycolatopsis sp. NPDC058278]|uniref:hypothetical protein n=1 Tax=Amycolatopsis sp. NPDC058278 TaxID=3346417 RepID=UPI0036DB8148
MPWWLVQGLNLLAIGAGANGLYDAMHPLLVGAVVVAALFVYFLSRLDPAQDIATHLPRALLYLTVAGVGLLVTTPPSWTGPIAVASVVCAMCAALAAQDRASALATLFGVSVFTVGVVGATGAVHAATAAGRILLTGAAAGVALLGLLCLWNRHGLLGPAGITMHTLRTTPMAWARLSVLGMIGIVAGFDRGGHGDPVAALLGVIGGACWVGVAIVFSFGERNDALAGTLLAMTGFSVVGLGWMAFRDEEFVMGLICMTTGATMAVAGLWLLDSAGFSSWLRRQFKPRRPS